MIHGEGHLPIPAVDSTAAHRNKRAVPLLPLLALMEITVGVTLRWQSWRFPVSSVSTQFIQELQFVAQTTLTLQRQIDSLAAVVLKKRQGADLLTAETGGLCLFLQKKGCFCVNQLGIVNNKIQQILQNERSNSVPPTSEPLRSPDGSGYCSS